MIFGINCNTFFQQSSCFPKSSVKTYSRNFSGISYFSFSVVSCTQGKKLTQGTELGMTWTLNHVSVID